MTTRSGQFEVMWDIIKFKWGDVSLYVSAKKLYFTKQNRLKLEFLDESFIEKQSKVDFSCFITDMIEVHIVSYNS